MKIELFGLTVAAKFDKEDMTAASIERAAIRQVKRDQREAQIETRRKEIREETEARAAQIKQRVEAIKNGEPALTFTENPHSAEELAAFREWQKNQPKPEGA